MKKLIINADGFGFTQGINHGILESIEHGIVTSVSSNVNFDHIKEVKFLIKNFPKISIGIHFNINVGKPVSDPKLIPSLLNENDEFWGNQLTGKFLKGKIKINEIEIELENQIKKLQELGVSISHYDGHQNKHLYPGYFNRALKVAKKYDIKRIRTHNRYLFVNNESNRAKLLFKYYLSNPIRVLSHSYGKLRTLQANLNGIKSAERLITPAYIDNSKKYFSETWINIIENLPAGINEIYCHPGYPDDELRKYASYVDERKLELEILTSGELKEAINKNKIELISFHDIF